MLDAVGELLSRLTKTRAGYLDAAVSSRLSSAIKTIQQGTILIATSSISATATITAVTIGKAYVINLGWGQNNAAAPAGSDQPRVTLTNSTTVTATTAGAGVIGNGVTVGFVVVEYW